MTTPLLSLRSPYECFLGCPPNFHKLKVFGCLCFPWIKPYAQYKLDPRSTPCEFLGYSPTQSAYFCLDRTTSRIYTSRHVVFREYVFPFYVSVPLTTNASSDHEVFQTYADTVTVTPIPSVSAHPLTAPNQNPQAQALAPMIPPSTGPLLSASVPSSSTTATETTAEQQTSVPQPQAPPA